MWSDNSISPPSNHAMVGQWLCNSAPSSPAKFLVKKPPHQTESFHVTHKVPSGDSPYVKAKHVQIVDKDFDRAIALFWAAINVGDRVDSALKDMAILMKQQNRPEEAIEAIKSFRFRCSDHAQEALDNILLDLYKRCGRLDDQINLLKHKLHLIHEGLVFNGKRTKTARSQGKKFQVSIEKEATRLLGNLGWVYMQQANYAAAEAVYRKALSVESDINKMCNLGICLMKQDRLEEAKAMLQKVIPPSRDGEMIADSHLKSYQRAQELLPELENRISSIKACSMASPVERESTNLFQPSVEGAFDQMEEQWQWGDNHFHVSNALLATKGFGPCPFSENRVSKISLQAALASSFDQLRPPKNALEDDDAVRRDEGFKEISPEATSSTYLSLGMSNDKHTKVCAGQVAGFYQHSKDNEAVVDGEKQNLDYRENTSSKQDLPDQVLDFTCVNRVVESVIPDMGCDTESLRSIPDDCFAAHLSERELNSKCQRRLQVFLDMTLPATQSV
ncbi:hypothetical protein O6H91_03G083500 [Diphasiastrum complanatum]|uniref:Uncharacterized protein n=1 Tax=Diphasiastrum complanatum TaxID=34168 RepID=A0ACC2E8H9_DIPCM|nr:hypothetical protein O6H91_03G083500 [Diphasiastrum complanatum]